MRRAPVLAILFTATFTSARTLDLPRPNEKWLTLTVDEFTFVSNISAPETTEMARDILQMRDAVGQLTQLKVRSPRPTRIIIFGSERAFAPYRDAIFNQKQENIRAVFTSSEGGNFILMSRDRGEDANRTIYHELTHYFVRNTVSGLPLWASEGIAEYYSTFHTARDSVHIGRPVVGHVQWLRGERLIPLAELLATTTESPIYDEERRLGVFYAQSWALFHYLMADDARRAQLGQFLRLLGERKPVDEAFRAAFPKSYAELERELRDYARGHAFPYTTYAMSALATPEVPRPEPLSREGLLYELGHLLVNAAPHAEDDARRFLHASAGHARAESDLQLLDGLRAQERGSMAEARRAFERSAELDPASVRAWNGIGATYVAARDDPAPGIAALEKSLALAPGVPETAFHLLQLYARAGRGPDAERMLNTVLIPGGAKKEMLDFAREALLMPEVRRMEALGVSGKTAEAAELARSLAARTTDASLREYLEAAIAELDLVTNTNRGIDAMNEAIVKANQGKVHEALAIVDEVLPRITDETIQAEAKKLRSELASQLAKQR